MAIDSLTTNFSNLEQAMANLIFLFKIFGGLFGVYILVLLVNMISNIRRNRLLKKIIENLEEISKKIKNK